MRSLAPLACLALGCAVPLTAQQRAWSGAFAAGYGTGTGSAFSGKGAIWATAAGFLPLSSTVRGGLELGYHRFDTIESRIPDGYGPGTLISEDFTRSMWQLSATMRLRASRHTWRPYFGSGLGAYLVHVRDHMQTQDASGASIPNWSSTRRRRRSNPACTCWSESSAPEPSDARGSAFKFEAMWWSPVGSRT
jgi:hypothetical protein